MIANSKKLVSNNPGRVRKQPQNSLNGGGEMTSHDVDNLLQIFRQCYLTNETVQAYPIEFARYIHAKSSLILTSFEKSINGKTD